MPYLIGAVGVLALLLAVIADRLGASSAGPASPAAEQQAARQPSPPAAPQRETFTPPAPSRGPDHPPAAREAYAPAPRVPPASEREPVPAGPPQLGQLPSATVRATAEHGHAPAWPAAAADLLRGLGRLPGVRGWAIVGAEGAVVAADPAMRTALIAGGDELARAAASVAERLGFADWRSVEVRGPAGSIQAMSGPGGWSLLALLGPEADGGRVIAEGRRILGSLAGE